jgi:hypothetical protein
VGLEEVIVQGDRVVEHRMRMQADQEHQGKVTQVLEGMWNLQVIPQAVAVAVPGLREIVVVLV